MTQGKLLRAVVAEDGRSVDLTIAADVPESVTSRGDPFTGLSTTRKRHI